MTKIVLSFNYFCLIILPNGQISSGTLTEPLQQSSSSHIFPSDGTRLVLELRTVLTAVQLVSLVVKPGY